MLTIPKDVILYKKFDRWNFVIDYEVPSITILFIVFYFLQETNKTLVQKVSVLGVYRVKYIYLFRSQMKNS
nr:MAG TPA: hypothetical protein [Caudoviricetes sp.]DAX22480.1 MAG TPA: hypothetical protein [Bacteriophage sp.]